ncbi:MAG: hypothetical protein IJ093_01810 [Bacilli bacterium]|nr:hypothetical protein [Bacilli bacterium]
MNRKTLNKLFRYVLMICFVTFMALYISQSNGYMEYQNRKQVALTEKQIKKFEEDVASGKKIDIKKYIKTSDKNYQNGLSRIGLKISRVAGSGVKNVVGKTFKFLSKLNE